MDEIWFCELEHLRAYTEKVIGADEETKKVAMTVFNLADRDQSREILTVNGDTAAIDIRGTLTNRPSFIGSFLGFNTTTYTDIQNAVEAIAADDTIKNVRLIIDSPGGNVTGLDETWLALRALGQSRKITAENHGLMASAAYWLATGAEEIMATSPSGEQGSIGVYLLITDYSEYDKKEGIRDIRIVSKNAPLKNPDPATAEGLKAYQSRLDALERVFISRISEGRGIPVKTVETDFGRGTVLIAADPDPSKPSALSVGMIDRVDGITTGAGRRRRRTAEAEGGALDAEGAGITRTGPRIASTAGDREGGASEAEGGNVPAGEVAGVKNPVDKTVQKTENQDNDKKSGGVPENGKVIDMGKFADLAAENPDLKAEVEGLIAAAHKKGADGAKPAAVSELALTALTGDGPKYIRELAVKVIKAEATEAELTAALGAYDAITEENKTKNAAKETDAQGNTPADPPKSEESSGEIKTEDDHKAAVARFRSARGLEAN